MSGRKTVRPSEPVYNRLKTEKVELGLKWDDYFEHLLENRDVEVRIPEEQLEELKAACQPDTEAISSRVSDLLIAELR